MPKAKYMQVDPNTYETYQIHFGASRVRSFPTETEARNYLLTEEAIELKRQNEGCWLIKITHEIMERYYI